MKLKLEISDNRRELAHVCASVVNERSDLINVLDYLQARIHNKPRKVNQPQVNFQLGRFEIAS